VTSTRAESLVCEPGHKSVESARLLERLGCQRRVKSSLALLRNLGNCHLPVAQVLRAIGLDGTAATGTILGQSSRQTSRPIATGCISRLSDATHVDD
jgi:hypothetical protein